MFSANEAKKLKVLFPRTPPVEPLVPGSVTKSHKIGGRRQADVTTSGVLVVFFDSTTEVGKSSALRVQFTKC